MDVTVEEGFSRADNRWCNLREASPAENSQNRTRYSGRHSKYAGVTWNARAKRWVSQIRVDGRNKGLGYFGTEIAAHRAYVAAKRRLHPFSNISNMARGNNDR